MSTIHSIAAAGLAVLCALAGYRLSARRIGPLRTALATTARAGGHDRLTGLPNRTQLSARLVQPDNERQPVVLAIVNLDGFAEANRFGHRVGDQLLVLQAARLRYTASRNGGIVYRLAGDEFAAVWPAQPEAATALATELLAALAEPVELHIGDYPVFAHVTATAGVVSMDLTGAADPTSRLLTRANTALQHGKRTARGSATLWQPQLPDLPRPRRDSRPRSRTAGGR